MRFQHQVSKRLYRFLSKRFYRGDQRLNLRDLAFEHVGLSRSYADSGKIKEKLQPALEELESVGFLEPMRREDRYKKNGRDWMIRLVEGRKKPSVTFSSVKVPEREPDPASANTVEELTARGVTKTKALSLAERFTADQIIAKIEVFDWLLTQKDKHIQKNAAGYLVSSILDDYATPKGYVSKAEREKLAKDAKEARQREEETARKKREERERERREQEAIDTYLKSISPEERDEIDRIASAQVVADGLTGPLARMGLDINRRAHIRQLLQDAGKLPV